MTPELRHAVADADRQPVAPAEPGAVAARAGLRRCHREAGVEIQLLAERGFLGRVRIFFRERDCRGSAIQGLEGVEPARRLLCDLDLAAFTDDGCAETDRAEADSANTGRCDCGGEDGIT